MPIALGPLQNFVILQLLIAWLRKLGLLPPDPAPDEGDLATVNAVRMRAITYVDSLPLTVSQRITQEGQVNALCNQFQANSCNVTWTIAT